MARFVTDIALCILVILTISSVHSTSRELAADSEKAPLTSNLDSPANGDDESLVYKPEPYNKLVEKPSKRQAIPDDLELQFKKTLLKICKSHFPDIESRDPRSTPFRHANCSVICVYGEPAVPIPDGEMCYLTLDFIGTLGKCKNGNCITDGPPFQFGCKTTNKPVFESRLVQALAPKAEVPPKPDASVKAPEGN